MVWPVLAVAGGTFLVNLNAAYENREISRQEYEEGLKALEEYEAKLRTLRPDETWESIEPKLLGEMAKYSPEIAGYVQENAPELVTEAGSQTERRVQREALQKYAAMSETGRDVISDAQREQALFEAGASAKERQRRLTEGMRQRGMMGTGAELAARLGAEQAGAVSARQEALQGVQQAEARRREALGQAASLAGQIRGQNVNVESSNVGTMNAFNQRMANSKNLYNQYVSGERNQAQQLNQQRDIQRSQYNLGLENQYSMFNRQQQEAARERARQFDVNLAGVGYEGRGGLRKGQFDADRKFNSDIATGITSAMGAGMSTYGAMNAASAAQAAAGSSGAQQAYWQSLLKSGAQGAAQGAGQALASDLTSESMDLGGDTTVGQQMELTGSTQPRQLATQQSVLPNLFRTPEEEAEAIRLGQKLKNTRNPYQFKKPGSRGG
jgi:hypothetical protein